MLQQALDIPEDGYVFIVTYGRSGSTLTQNLLNALPGYCIRGENGNLAYFLSRAIHLVATHDMFAWRREDAGKPPEQRRPYLRPLIGKDFDPWAGAENVDPQQLALSLMNLFVEQVLRPEATCRVSGFKEIRFHEDPAFFPAYMAILRDVFPKARFLFQTRDHGAVARSGWWATKPEDDVKAELARAEALFTDFADANPAICYTIAYEGYSEGPGYARQIFDFLEEPFDAALVSRVLSQALSH